MRLRLLQDNMLKTMCDLVIIVVCACELAYQYQLAVDDDAATVKYAAIFDAVMACVLVSCALALGVKVCRLMVHAGSARRAPHAVLACVDGTPDLAAPGGSNAAPEHLQEEQSAMNKYCAIGVVNGREEELLRNYFERVRVSEGRRQQMFQEEGGVPWVFVSTPERIPDGHGGHEQVMEFIQGVCREHPWQFKQAFDWASSGNSYPADNAAWDKMKPDMTAWFAAIKSGDEDRASENIKLNIAPVFLGLDWFHARAALLRTHSNALTQWLSMTLCRLIQCHSQLLKTTPTRHLCMSDRTLAPQVQGFSRQGGRRASGHGARLPLAQRRGGPRGRGACKTDRAAAGGPP